MSTGSSQNTNKQAVTSLNLPSYNGDAPYLFVSYSHEDTEAVRKVLLELTAEKYRFWYDDTMEIGKDFRDSLRDRILCCAGFLAFFSDKYFESKYCGMELLTAIGSDKRILPVYLKAGVKYPAVLDGPLEHVQHVQIIADKDSDNFKKSIKSLLASLPKDTRQSLEVKGKDTLFKCTDASEKISIPDSEEPGVPGVVTIDREAFRNCEKLVEIDLGDKVKRLRKESFRGCKSLSSLVLPQSVEHVGESAFRDCVSLKSLVVKNPNIEICDRAFENCASLSSITLPMALTEIYGGVFNSCKSLESVDLPTELTVLGESSFADCSKLSEVAIPASVTKIDDLVFSGCSKISRVVFCGAGESSEERSCKLTKIGKNAFKDCRALSVIEIPSKVSSIGSGPFRGCSSLKRIIVMPGNRHFKEIDGVLFNKSRSVLICYPSSKRGSSYEIPDSVTTISDWAFCESRYLQDVQIPDSVVEIGEGAFHFCSELTEIALPDSVERIDDTAFRGCEKLRRVVIPGSVKEFGWGIFNGCKALYDGDGIVICPDGSPAASYCHSKGINHAAKK
jgi:hypothetical protein